MPGKGVGSSKRPRPAGLIAQGRLLVFTACALAVAVAVAVASGAPTGPAHAADPAANPTADPGTAAPTTSPAASTPAEDAVSWNPGVVTYLVDNGGCRTAQIASIDTATPAIADMVSAGLVEDSVKLAHFSSKDPDVKVVEINNVQKNGTHIAFMIDAWLSNTACAQATSTTPQQASFTTGHATGAAATTPHVLGTVNLSDRHQIALMSASTWFKVALKVLFVAVVFAAINALILEVIAVIVAEGGTALAIAVQAALAGCIGMAIAELIAKRFLNPDDIPTFKSRGAFAAFSCIVGAFAGTTLARTIGPALAAGVRRRLNTTPAIMGDSGLDAAKQAGVDVTHLADLVDGVADGALQAAQ